MSAGSRMSAEPTQSLASSTPAATPRRSRLRLLYASLLVVVGAFAALMWAGTAETAVTASLEAATHGVAQGLSVTAHPDTYFVYSEDGTAVAGITVAAADGSRLPVTLMSESFTYGPHREGLQVGSFEVPVGAGLADYRVVVATTDEQGGSPIAVTTFDVAGFNRTLRWGVGALLVVNISVAVVLLVSSGGTTRPGALPSPAGSTTGV